MLLAFEPALRGALSTEAVRSACYAQGKLNKPSTLLPGKEGRAKSAVV